MDNMIKKIEDFMELGGIKKDILFLVIGGMSPYHQPFRSDPPAF